MSNGQQVNTLNKLGKKEFNKTNTWLHNGKHNGKKRQRTLPYYSVEISKIDQSPSD